MWGSLSRVFSALMTPFFGPSRVSKASVLRAGLGGPGVDGKHPHVSQNSFLHAEKSCSLYLSPTVLVANGCSLQLLGKRSSLSSVFAQERGLLGPHAALWRSVAVKHFFGPRFGTPFGTETRTATPARCLQETEVCDRTAL